MKNLLEIMDRNGFSQFTLLNCMDKADQEYAYTPTIENLDKVWSNIREGLMNCYWNDFINVVIGCHTYWTASNLELRAIQNRQERSRRKMQELMGKDYKEPKSLAFLSYGYQIAEMGSCESLGEMKIAFALADSAEKFIEKMMDDALQRHSAISRDGKNDDKEHRYLIIEHCLDCASVLYNYHWLTIIRAINFFAVWRSRRKMKAVVDLYKALLTKIWGLSKSLGLEENPEKTIGARIMGLENNNPTIEDLALMPCQRPYHIVLRD